MGLIVIQKRQVICFEEAYATMDNFLCNHFSHVGFIVLGTVVLYAYLHYELTCHNRDLIYWQKLLRQCYNEIGRYKYAYSLITFIAVVNLLIVGIAITFWSNKVHWMEEEEEHEEQLKERYRNFIFIRLLNAVDKIEQRYLKAKKTPSGIEFENLVRAHDEIWSAIVEFRKDAQKLYKLNETEIWMPLEDVYCLLEEEEREVVKSPYHREGVTIDYETLSLLLFE